MSSRTVVDFLLSGFTDNSGNPLASGKVYTYSAGTTTPKDTYIDRVGGSAEANPIILDSNGRKQVYADGGYKFVVKTSADVTLYTFDNIYFGTGTEDGISFLGTASGGANTFAATPSPAFTAYTAGQIVSFRAHQSNTGASVLNISALGAKNIKKGDGNIDLAAGDIANGSYVVAIYEADNGGQFRILDSFPSADGFLDASLFGNTSAAINTALGISRNVRVPAGNWSVTSEIAITNDSQHLLFEGSVLQAGADSINIIHWSASYGKISGFLKIDGNSRTGITALRVTPADEAQTSVRVDQNFNTFSDIWILGCAEGIVLKCGPDVAAADSGCWYNRFYNIHIQGCTRGIWLKDGPNASSAGNNRNQFYSVRIGQTSSNTGVQIDSGDTNVFVGCSFEGILTGTSPNTTPTAIKIALAGTYSGDNNDNRFLSPSFESCTRDIENANTYSAFENVSNLTNPLWTANPRYLSGYDPSVVPNWFTEYLLLQQNSQIASHINGFNFKADIAIHTNKEVYDYGLGWAAFALTTSNMTNVTSVLEYQSKYKRFSNIIEWHFRVQFRATVAGTVVRINFPAAPESNLYRLYSNILPMKCPVYANSLAVIATFSDHSVGTPYLEVAVPAGNWDTAAANNHIMGMVRFHV